MTLLYIFHSTKEIGKEFPIEPIEQIIFEHCMRKVLKLKTLNSVYYFDVISYDDI